jgi:hypothetical protein
VTALPVFCIDRCLIGPRQAARLPNIQLSSKRNLFLESEKENKNANTFNILHAYSLGVDSNRIHDTLPISGVPRSIIADLTITQCNPKLQLTGLLDPLRAPTHDRAPSYIPLALAPLSTLWMT